MATSSAELAALLESLQGNSGPSKQQQFFQALGTLGAGLGRAGATRTLNQPAIPVSEALGAFAQDLERGRQRARQERSNTLALNLQAAPAIAKLKRQERFDANKEGRIKAAEIAGVPKATIELLKLQNTPEAYASVFLKAKSLQNSVGQTKFNAQLALARLGNTGLTQIAKLNKNLKDGKITKEQHAAGIKKATNISDSGVKTLADVMLKQISGAGARADATAAQNVRTRSAAVFTQARLVKEAAKILQTEGGKVQGIVRIGGRLIQGAKSQIKAIINAKDSDTTSRVSRALNGIETDLASFDFGNLAAQGAKFKSTMIGMAILRARADEKGRLSDDDVQRALTQVGASSISPEEAIGAMFSSIKQSVFRVEDEIDGGLSEGAQKLVAKTHGNKKFRENVKKRLGDFSDAVFGDNPLSIFGGGGSASSPNVQQLPSGSTFTIK
jgi:hypothetical protein